MTTIPGSVWVAVAVVLVVVAWFNLVMLTPARWRTLLARWRTGSRVLVGRLGIRDGVQRGAANVLELATDPAVLRRAVLWAVLNWGPDIGVVLVLAMTVGLRFSVRSPLIEPASSGGGPRPRVAGRRDVHGYRRS